MNASVNLLSSDVASKAGVRLLIFGESHQENQPLHKFCHSAIEEITNLGFTHLALELVEQQVETLERYCRGEIDLDLAKKDIVLSRSNLTASLSDDFFLLVKSAYDRGLRLVAFNEQAPNREDKMFDRISTVLRDNESHKIMMVVGAAHAMVRKGIVKKGHFKSLAEKVIDTFGSGSVYNVAQMMPDMFGNVDVPSREKLARRVPGFITLRGLTQLPNDPNELCGYRFIVGQRNRDAMDYPDEVIQPQFDSWCGFYWYKKPDWLA